MRGLAGAAGRRSACFVRPQYQSHADTRAESSSSGSSATFGTCNVGRFPRCRRLGSTGTDTLARRNCVCLGWCGLRLVSPNCVSSRKDHCQPDETAVHVIDGRLRRVPGDPKPHVRGSCLHAWRMGCILVDVVGTARSTRVCRVHHPIPDRARGESALHAIRCRIFGVQVTGPKVAMRPDRSLAADVPQAARGPDSSAPIDWFCHAG